MHLTNFTLRYESNSVELEAFGYNWDLHNQTVFRGLKFEPLTGDVTMEWTPADPSEKNPWGDFDNHASLCRLRFSGVSLLRMGSRDDAYPASESDCVESIDIIADAEPERMVFNWQDERAIEIAAKTVTMEREG